MDDRINQIKYNQFILDPAYSLFLYILNNETEQIVNQMLNEPDKDKLYILQKQAQTLQRLPDLIRAKAQRIEEE